MTDEWFKMDTAPRDGTVFDLLCKSKENVEVIVPNIKYGHAPMDKTRLVLWGNQNMLSSYLEPLGWRPATKKAPPVKKEIDPAAVEPWDKTKHPYPI